MKKITLTIAAIFAAFTMNAQDTCADAQEINAGNSYTVTTIDGDLPQACLQPTQGGPETATAGEWYTYTAGSADEVVTITTDLEANTNNDTRINVYSGLCGDLTCISANDDVDAANNNFLSTVSFLAEADQTYIIAFDDYWSQSEEVDNEFDFEVSMSTDVPDLPGVASTPTPESGATDVMIDTQNENAVAFAWEAPTTGGEANDYVVLLGDAPDNLNTLGATPNTSVNITGMEFDTEYFWAIIPRNVAGTADQENVQVWSFTTESTAGVEDVTENTFKHFINNNVLTVEANTAIENVRIFNILGQQVATQEVSAQQTNVNVSSFKAGVYLAQVQIAGKTQTFKFVKK